ncbi:hypothetical protein NDU88_003810 [Pleurodeles waltl]|uniref:Uncharacterized protein n=1 Tax=Pleurodeles waltl TaxID=8319 RepID=A0AAV7NQR2_PLEWA|nr:hypothetical protein NDU88_003810 [Pleurodeles waltl]
MLQAPLQPKRRPERRLRHRPSTVAALSFGTARPTHVSRRGRRQQPCELCHDFPLQPQHRNRGRWQPGELSAGRHFPNGPIMLIKVRCYKFFHQNVFCEFGCFRRQYELTADGIFGL